MTLWIPAGLTSDEREGYCERVCILMESGISQEQAERDAWYEYYQAHPEKFTHRITFHFAPIMRKDANTSEQLTLQDYRDSNT